MAKQPDVTQPGEPTQLSEKLGDSTRLSNPTPVSAAARLSGAHPPAPAATPADDLRETAHDAVRIEEELLHEMKRMNSQLAQLTHGYRRYTLSFFSGIIRGLGAAIGATVVFALFIAAVSRLDTTPLIGNYVRKIMNVVRTSGPTGGIMDAFSSSPTVTVSPAETPVVTVSPGDTPLAPVAPTPEN